MDHISSYQYPEKTPRSLPSGGAGEELSPLNVANTDDAIFISTRGRVVSSTTAGRLKFPMIVALSLWLVIMTVELSPFLLMLQNDEATGSNSSASQYDDDNDTDDNDDDTLSALWGSSPSFSEIIFGIRPCSVEECLSSPCSDAKTTRFSCLSLQHDPKMRGGCGPTPWTREICADQCDGSGCAYLLQRISSSTSSSVEGQDHDHDSNRNRNRSNDHHCNVDCPKQWCERRRLCGSELTPYQCTVGDSIYGCSADKYEWTVRSSETDCSACCNTSTCS